jgi:hypothetical protein
MIFYGTTSITDDGYSKVRYLRYCLSGWGFMVFNATFNNISVISWRAVLLGGETGVSCAHDVFLEKNLLRHANIKKTGGVAVEFDAH